jgi:ribosomal-protein-serine acetyltransferase
MKDKLLLEIPDRMETENLIVRKFERGDGKDILDLFNRRNNRELLKESVEEATRILSQDDAEIDCRRHAAEWESRERFVMGIWEKKSNTYIGQIWIEPEKWEVPSFELGYFLDVGYQGKGLAYEASVGTLEFLFANLNAYRITIMTRDTNAKSWKLAERLGFQREGHIRECSIKNGKRWGLYHYGMLKREYTSSKSGQEK